MRRSSTCGNAYPTKKATFNPPLHGRLVPQARRKGQIVVRRRGDGFPWRSAAHAAGDSLVGTAQSPGTARERWWKDRTEEPTSHVVQRGFEGGFRFVVYRD